MMPIRSSTPRMYLLAASQDSDSTAEFRKRVEESGVGTTRWGSIEAEVVVAAVLMFD